MDTCAFKLKQSPKGLITYKKIPGCNDHLFIPKVWRRNTIWRAKREIKKKSFIVVIPVNLILKLEQIILIFISLKRKSFVIVSNLLF